METVLELLRKAMQNARMLAVIQFDPALFLFTSALQVVITKAEAHLAKNKHKASESKKILREGVILLAEYNSYLGKTFKKGV